MPGLSGFMTAKQMWKSIHSTPQLRCGADISTTFYRKSPQHHRISNKNECNFHAIPQCSTSQFLCRTYLSPFFPHTITDWNHMKRDSAHLPSALGNYMYRGLHIIPTENAFIVYKSTIFLSAILGTGACFLLESGDFHVIRACSYHKERRRTILAVILFSNPNQRVKSYTFFEEPWVLELACQNCI